MEFSFSVDMHDKDGDPFERGVFVHLGSHTILHFADSRELRDFANEILKSLSEIREAEDNRHRQ